MSVVLRILSWVWGLVTSVFGFWLSRRMVQKAAEAQAQAQGQGTEESKGGTT